jgi:hypothetical protein
MPTLPGFKGVRVPKVLQPHRVDVQRMAQAGVDQSGMPVEGVSTVYTAVPCAVDLHTAGEGHEWEQAGMDLTGFVYFGTRVGSPPDVPDVRKGDRLLFGVWPGGQPRYLEVVDYLDELDAGVVGVCTIRARKPGGV